MITTKNEKKYNDAQTLQPLSVLFLLDHLCRRFFVLFCSSREIINQLLEVFVCVQIQRHIFPIEFSLILLYQYNNLLIVWTSVAYHSQTTTIIPMCKKNDVYYCSKKTTNTTCLFCSILLSFQKIEQRLPRARPLFPLSSAKQLLRGHVRRTRKAGAQNQLAGKFSSNSMLIGAISTYIASNPPFVNGVRGVWGPTPQIGGTQILMYPQANPP